MGCYSDERMINLGAGYHNLLKLASIAYEEGFYYKPRIDREVLQQYSDGLICTSACLGGELTQALLRGDRQAAEEIARYYLGVFGEDRFYIELQDHGLEEQKLTNPMLVDLAGRLGIGLIATNDIHYLEQGDADEQHHLSRLTARLLELGGTPVDLPGGLQDLSLEGWEAEASQREDREIEFYDGFLEAEYVDAETRELLAAVLESEHQHRRHLGGKWMSA